MIITGLTLTDIKSYRRETQFTFHPGVNLIKGENGAGKSTLVEAIGYALFDLAPYRPIDNFVRRGARKGEIRVRFLSDDDREYEVIREVGGSNYYAIDRILGRSLARGASDVSDWLHDWFHVDKDLPLANLFQNAIGVPQGMMTSDFLRAEGPRSLIFNALLRVDSYTKAHGKLLDTTNYIDELLKMTQTRIAHLEGQLVSYAEWKSEQQTLYAAIAELTEHLRQALDEQTQIIDAWEILERQSQDLRMLQEDTARKANTLEHQRELLERAKALCDSAEYAAEILCDAEAGFNGFQVANNQLLILEADQKRRDELRETFHEIEKKVTALRGRIEHAEISLRNAQEAESLVQTLAPLILQQIQLEEELEVERKHDHTRANLVDQLNVKRRDEAELAQRVEVLITQLEQRETIEQEVALLNRHLLEFTTELHELVEQRLPLQAAQIELRTQIDAERQRVNDFDKLTEHITRDLQRLNTLAEREIELRVDLERRAFLESERVRIDEELQAANNALMRAKTEIKNAEDELETLRARQQLLSEQDSLCPVCQQPMGTHAYENANAHYEAEIVRLQSVIAATRVQEKVARTQQKTLTKTRDEFDLELREIEMPAALDRLRDDISSLRAGIEQTQLTRAALEDAPDNLPRLQQGEDVLLQQLQATDKHRATLEKIRDERQHALNELRQRLAELPQQSILDSARSDLSDIQTNIELWEQQLTDLNNVGDRLQMLQTALTTLDDPRSRARQAQVIADTSATIAHELEEYESERTLLDGQHAATSSDLTQFERLDMDIETYREQKALYEANYRRYLAHQVEAAQLTERQIEVDHIEAEIARLDREIEQLQTQCNTLNSSYDVAEHTRLIDRRQKLEREVASHQASLGEKQKQLERVEAELVRLNDVQSEKETAAGEAKRIYEHAGVLRYFRDQLKEVGPHIRRRLVQSISAQAAEYFGDILDDRSQRLIWDPEAYDIQVKYAGETRSFAMLSGGEQMSAALAVRMALLTQMTSIRFMFLDEPTTNLDERRRSLLADNLAQIKTLQQLFVISHDTTFEHSASHSIFIRKQGDVSQVEVT